MEVQSNLSRRLICLSHRDLNEITFELMQIALDQGALHLVSIERWFKTEVSFVDMLQGPLWLIKWKDEERAIIRTQDDELALDAGVEFASNGGHKFAVVDEYDWSSQYTKTKTGKVVTTEELSVSLLTWEECKTMQLTIECKY